MARKEMSEHILSLSYGKDSLACLGAIEELGWPLDRIVHAEVMATVVFQTVGYGLEKQAIYARRLDWLQQLAEEDT